VIAPILADYRRYVRMFGARMSVDDFAQFYLGLIEGVSKAKVPNVMGCQPDPKHRRIDTTGPAAVRCRKASGNESIMRPVEAGTSATNGQVWPHPARRARV
jgi:hypothetical protein